jgi:hypothetical protein
MSEDVPSQAEKTAPPVEKTSGMTPRHYEALCGLALAAIFLVQLQQASSIAPVTLIANLIIVLIGTLGILYKVRLSPVFVLIALAVPHLIEQANQLQLFGQESRGFRFELADVLLSVAMLTYLIGQYRLYGLRFGVLPGDPRQSVKQQARSPGSLGAAELVALIFPVPAFALLAEFVALLLRQPWRIVNMEAKQHQFFVVAWVMFLAIYVSAHAFRYWRRNQMDELSAELILQDALWDETRGEQRRIQRWLTWRKMKS